MTPPPATAWPFTAATSGFGKARSIENNAPRLSSSASTYAGPSSTTRKSSTPAEKADSVPVSTTARTEPSLRARSNSAASASENSTVRTFAGSCAIRISAVPFSSLLWIMSSPHPSRLGATSKLVDRASSPA